MSTTIRGGRSRRRPLLAAAVLASLVAMTGCATPGPPTVAPESPSPTATATPTPTPTPLTPEEELLATTDDPNACAVTFLGDGVVDPPQLQTQGALYDRLPIPSRDGFVFAGWYATTADAASLSIPGRVNGSEPVVCTDQRTTLYGAWTTPEANAQTNARIPILMYHQFTTKPEGESGWLRGNYAYIGDFEAHIQHIASTGFYLPTWDELNAFIDGRLYLPNHSVIVTDDDADQTWFDLAAPIVAKYKVLTTSFMITAYRQDPAPSIYVLRRSHTHDMHQAGADGRGRMVNWTVDQIVADLEASAAALGVKEVLAYPFGHYNDTAKQAVAQAGFEMARTIDWGYVTIGTDKLALPTIRVSYGTSLNQLINDIG